MLDGRLYIDGKDLYTCYGVCVALGGWNELIAMPPLKAVSYNDWQEEDGIEPDLSAPVLNSQEATISFIIKDAYSRFFALLNTLSDGSYHIFDCISIGRTYRLRLVSCGSLTVYREFAQVQMKFADDFPLSDYTYRLPESTLSSDDRWTLDGRAFSDYGLRILQGSLSEVAKSADVKTNLLRNITTQQGAVYDPETVTYKSKDVKLYCLMTAPTCKALWRNYDALLYDLVRPDERLLGVSALEKDFPCYYKSCQVSEFFPDEDRAWLRFTLTLTFTRDFRITDDDMVLATEDDIIVFTEDGGFAIELAPMIVNNTVVRLVTKDAVRLLSGGAIRFK